MAKLQRGNCPSSAMLQRRTEHHLHIANNNTTHSVKQLERTTRVTHHAKVLPRRGGECTRIHSGSEAQKDHECRHNAHSVHEEHGMNQRDAAQLCPQQKRQLYACNGRLEVAGVSNDTSAVVHSRTARARTACAQQTLFRIGGALPACTRSKTMHKTHSGNL
jgi:hypothetical protein